MGGLVYFIRPVGELGPIKIGYTTDLLKRLRSLNGASPSQLEAIAWIEADPKYERHLHARFERARLRGEWFAPAALLLDFIASLEKRAPLSAGRPARTVTLRKFSAAERLAIRAENIRRDREYGLRYAQSLRELRR